MAFNINELKANLTYGGARPSLFQVQFNNPANSSGNIKVPFLVRASSIPEAQVGNIAVGYFGRKINLAGDRTFQPWNITVINDEDFLIRNAMEQWSNQINTFEGNLRDTDTASPTLYKSDATIIQYGKTGQILRQYTMHGIYPQNVQPINLDWNTTDTIEEFQVTFQYDWWEVTGGITGNAGGS
jgi:hypothetical protein